MIAATGIITILLSQWLQQAVLRYLPELKQKQKLQLFNNNFIIILFIIIILFSLIALLIYPVFKSNLSEYSRFYFYGLLLIVGDVLFRNLITVLQAHLKSSKYMVYKIANAITKLAFSLILIFFIVEDIAMLVIGAAASFIILVVFLIKDLHLFSYWRNPIKSFELALLKRFVLYGLPMIGWFMGSSILSLSDRFIIEIFKGSVQVGIYASNYSLVSSGLGLIASPIVMAAHPLLINAWETGNKDRIQAIITIFSRYFLLFAFPILYKHIQPGNRLNIFRKSIQRRIYNHPYYFSRIPCLGLCHVWT